MSYAVKVEALGKRYKIHDSVNQPQRLLRDEIMGWLQKSPFRKKPWNEFWALQDISFEIKEGDRLGVIGRNGAGKSTLLKLLSRVVEPTTGQIIYRGRMSSLLEVGAGFHSELTGRENIYLNGVIMGMTRREVRRKFDEIVEFSGVAKFLDIQVKHYSSGMYVRLAFSVAAHLDPEILVMDEVLAVGDADFQKKCLGKMDEFSKGGRSIIFVSHNARAVVSLCNLCLHIDQGKTVRLGPSAEIIADYLSHGHLIGKADFSAFDEQAGDDTMRLTHAEILDENQQNLVEVNVDQPFEVRMKFCVNNRSDRPLMPSIRFILPGGECAFITHPARAQVLAAGDYEARCMVPGNLLNEGIYSIDLSIGLANAEPAAHFLKADALQFNVRDTNKDGMAQHGHGYSAPGAVRPLLPWTVKNLG